MKSIVVTFAILTMGMILSSKEAMAQGTGTMQATAQVVDTRDAWAGLKSAVQVAALGCSGRVETAWSQVSATVAPGKQRWMGTASVRPATMTVTIQYLHN